MNLPDEDDRAANPPEHLQDQNFPPGFPRLFPPLFGGFPPAETSDGDGNQNTFHIHRTGPGSFSMQATFVSGRPSARDGGRSTGAPGSRGQSPDPNTHDATFNNFASMLSTIVGGQMGSQSSPTTEQRSGPSGLQSTEGNERVHRFHYNSSVRLSPRGDRADIDVQPFDQINQYDIK
jgi:hypothetical protein